MENQRYYFPQWGGGVLLMSAIALQVTLLVAALLGTPSSSDGAGFGIPLLVISFAGFIGSVLFATIGDSLIMGLGMTLAASSVTTLMMLGRFMYHRFGPAGLISVPLGTLVILLLAFAWGTWAETRRVTLEKMKGKFK